MSIEVNIPRPFVNEVTAAHVGMWPESSITDDYVRGLYLLLMLSNSETENFKVTRDEWKNAVNYAYEQSGKPCSQIEFHDRACRAIGFKGGSHFHYQQNRMAHRKRVSFFQPFSITNFYSSKDS